MMEFLRGLFKPTAGNLGGWALAVGVVGIWQYYEVKKIDGAWTEDTKEWNSKVLATKTKRSASSEK